MAKMRKYCANLKAEVNCDCSYCIKRRKPTALEANRSQLKTLQEALGEAISIARSQHLDGLDIAHLNKLEKLL